MVRELGDVEQIGDELAHHLAGVVAVIVGEGEALVLVEQVLAHVALHARAHDVPPGGDVILAEKAHHIHREQSEADGAKAL